MKRIICISHNSLVITLKAFLRASLCLFPSALSPLIYYYFSVQNGGNGRGVQNRSLNVRKMKTGLVCWSQNRALFCFYLLTLAAAVFGIAVLWFNTDLCILGTRLNTKLALYYGPDIGFTLPIPILNPIAWNALMKAINGNIKNCINISHWKVK